MVQCVRRSSLERRPGILVGCAKRSARPRPPRRSRSTDGHAQTTSEASSRPSRRRRSCSHRSTTRSTCRGRADTRRGSPARSSSSSRGGLHPSTLGESSPHRRGRGVRLGTSEEQAEFDRVLATVLFTDIVGLHRAERRRSAIRRGGSCSSGTMTDRARDARPLPRHERSTRWATGSSRRSTVPPAACGAPQAIAEAVRPLGLEIRAGLHTGEVDVRRRRCQGIAVHIGARVGALAGAIRGPGLPDREGPRGRSAVSRSRTPASTS